MNDFWEEMTRPGPATTSIDGVEVRRGSRVRLKPRSGGDVLDAALAGRSAVVEGVDHDDAGVPCVAVTLEDDPGRDLGDARQPAHRFFFRADEVEPLAAPSRRVLVAGIGNVFLGDDGFGVAVAQRLARRPPLPGVTVGDFGIRGMDLAYALQDYDAVVLVDAAPRGHAPGTLSVIVPDLDDASAPTVEGHAMDPVRVLRLARVLGRVPERVRVVACEPLRLADDDEPCGDLSDPVRAAVDTAIGVVDELLVELGCDTQPKDGGVS